MKISRRNILAAGGSTAIIAMAGAGRSTLAQSVAPQTSASDALGANARQAMIDIFRKKDVAAVDELETEAHVRTVGAEARHRVVIRQHRQRPRRHRDRRLGEELFDEPLDERHDRGAAHEGHLEVDLRELRLAIGA